MKAIYFIPVKSAKIEDIISKWEYYRVDKEVLEDLFEEVIVCYTFLDVLRNIKNTGFILGWWWHRSLSIILLSKLFRIKVYVTGAIHMFDPSGAEDFYTKTYLYRFVNRIGLRFADRNLFISDSQKKHICSHLKVQNPHVVKSSLNKEHGKDKLKVIREKIDLDRKKEITFLTICWQKEDTFIRKGIYETLGAVKLISDSYPEYNFKWLIAGESDSEAYKLKSKIKTYKLEGVVDLIEGVSDSEIIDLYTNSDLYIQPSWYEGFGNSVLEAMSWGLPCLVSASTSQPEVVGESGYIVNCIDSRNIASKLLMFLESDAETRKKMKIEAIKETEENFLFTRRVEDLKDLLIKDYIL